MKILQRGGHVAPEEFGDDGNSQFARDRPLVRFKLRHHRQRYPRIGIVFEILFLEAGEVSLPVRCVPRARHGRAGRVNGADAGIEQRFDCRVGVRRRTAVVRVVDDGGDACIDTAQCSDHVADIDVARPVILGEREMGGVAVVFHRSRIRVYATQLSFPGVAMGIHHAGDRDHIGCIDDLRTFGFEVETDSCDRAVVNQDVCLGQVTDFAIHADDGSAPDQDARGDCGQGSQRLTMLFGHGDCSFQELSAS